jgi:hypothetical protein
MKTLVLLSGCIATLFGSVQLIAQTNKPAKGVGSTITFKTSKGVEVKEARVISVDFDGLVWRAQHPDGRAFGGRVNFSELPLEVAKEFGHDPQKSAVANAGRAKAAAQQRAAATESRNSSARAAAAANTKMVVIGLVSQNVRDGVMVIGEDQAPKMWSTSQFVRAPSGLDRATTTWRGPPTTDGTPIFVGRCLVTDVDNKGSLFDGQKIQLTIYPNGSYAYESVGAGSKTIPRFTVKPGLVTEPAKPEVFNALKETYRFNTPKPW